MEVDINSNMTIPLTTAVVALNALSCKSSILVTLSLPPATFYTILLFICISPSPLLPTRCSDFAMSHGFWILDSRLGIQIYSTSSITCQGGCVVRLEFARFPFLFCFSLISPPFTVPFRLLLL